MKTITKLLIVPIALLFFVSCDDDTPSVLEVPATYSFERDGQSSVSYSGQTDRINHLKEIKSLMGDANAGNQISGQDLTDMYANTNGDGNGNFDFTSTKQLKDKTFQADQTLFEDLMADMGLASVDGANNVTAESGTAGLLTRQGSGNTILVDEKGHEFTQIIEKGLMGAVFYHQILAVYLSDSRVGDGVDNTEIEEGKNYTAMEHHWDEAFGYLGVPVDFKSNWPSDRNGEAVFWGNYIRGRDALLGSSDILMDAFKTGRAAIVANDFDTKNEQREIIYAELEKVSAATAIHYINSTLGAVGDDGEYFHALSEAYAFIRALKFSPKASFTDAEITQLLKDISDDNLNFWNSTQNGLNNAKNTISTKFGFDSIKDDL